MSLGQSEHGILGLDVHPDGSVKRHPLYPSIPADGIASVDVVIQIPASHSIGARVFLPRERGGGKLPVVLYFHGGGFVLFSAHVSFYHGFCEKLAEVLRAVIVSVDYRLAPEHKLPAAYEDGLLAVRWLELEAASSGSGSCPLLDDHADFSRCFVLGDSAGANIIHNVLLAGDRSSHTELIKGVALLQPFFGGEERTEQEIRMRHDRYVPLVANDMLWKLALPAGWDRDCEACSGRRSRKRLALKILVVVGGRDPMYERQLEYVKRIKAGGGDVKLVEYKTASHGFMILNVTKPAHAQSLLLLLNELKHFISSGNVTSKL